MPTVKMAVVSLVVALALTAAACGGDDSSGSSAGTTTSTRPAATPSGKANFTGEGGCGGCHTLADAGASGQVGPNLDRTLKGKSAEFIRQSIVEPNAAIAKGFGRDVMPEDFEQRLGAAKVDALVSYLQSATSG